MFKNNEKNWRKKPRIREHTQTPKKKKKESVEAPKNKRPTGSVHARQVST